MQVNRSIETESIVHVQQKASKAMTRKSLIILFVLAGAALAGCSNALEKENAELKARITALEQENKLLKAENERLSSLVTDLHATVNDLNAVVGRVLPKESQADKSE